MVGRSERFDILAHNYEVRLRKKRGLDPPAPLDLRALDAEVKAKEERRRLKKELKKEKMLAEGLKSYDGRTGEDGHKKIGKSGLTTNKKRKREGDEYFALGSNEQSGFMGLYSQRCIIPDRKIKSGHSVAEYNVNSFAVNNRWADGDRRLGRLSVENAAVSDMQSYLPFPAFSSTFVNPHYR